jgi:LPS-assembly protein
MRPGERFDMIIEPVVMAAVATEDAADPRIVNEDSLAFELDDTNLFRPNAAPNYDLWEPGPRVSVGVRATARAHSGESASIIVGRRWREDRRWLLGEQSRGEVGLVASADRSGQRVRRRARMRLDDQASKFNGSIWSAAKSAASAPPLGT